MVINEFVASNQRSLLDGDGNASDWIELYNGSAASVSLGGWCLTDDRSNLRKWSFPRGLVLPAGKYLVVFASGQTAAAGAYVDPKGYLHTNFSLDKDGEYLALVDPDGAVVHEYAPRYPPQQTDISYGLRQGAFRYFSPADAGTGQWVGVPRPRRADHPQPRAGILRPAVRSADFLRHAGGGDSLHPRWLGADGAARHCVQSRGTPILITTTTDVRSAAFKTGWKPAGVTTHTYIFVNDVARQPANPPGWPSDWGYDSEVDGTVPADYAMDPRVVNSTLPGYSVREALLDIPTVSISMLPDDFISRATGIWANPLSLWERKCSIEYILPDSTEGFQHDCKIEAHGGSSRRPWRMQKHSLRLTFTSQYGPAKLKYPLFPGLDVDEFNQLILRGGFCDSWALVSWDTTRYRPNDAQYIRDTWMKESLRDMGQPSSYSQLRAPLRQRPLFRPLQSQRARGRGLHGRSSRADNPRIGKSTRTSRRPAPAGTR